MLRVKKKWATSNQTANGSPSFHWWQRVNCVVFRKTCLSIFTSVIYWFQTEADSLNNLLNNYNGESSKDEGGQRKGIQERNSTRKCSKDKQDRRWKVSCWSMDVGSVCLRCLWFCHLSNHTIHQVWLLSRFKKEEQEQKHGFYGREWTSLWVTREERKMKLEWMRNWKESRAPNNIHTNMMLDKTSQPKQRRHLTFLSSNYSHFYYWLKWSNK